MESLIPQIPVLFIKSEEISPETLLSLSELNIEVFHLRLMNFSYIEFQENLIKTFTKLEKLSFSALAFNSVNSAIALKLLKEKFPWKFIEKHMKIFVVGEKTANFLTKEFALNSTIIAKNFEELLEKIREYYTENPEFVQKILYFIGNLSDLSSAKAKNLEIEEIMVYKTKEISFEEFSEGINAIIEKIGGFPRVLVYFSPSNVRFFFEFWLKYKEKNNEKKVFEEIIDVKHVCFGEKTRKEFEVFRKKFKEKGGVLKEENVWTLKTSNIKEVPVILKEILNIK